MNALFLTPQFLHKCVLQVWMYVRYDFNKHRRNIKITYPCIFCMLIHLALITNSRIGAKRQSRLMHNRKDLRIWKLRYCAKFTEHLFYISERALSHVVELKIRGDLQSCCIIKLQTFLLLRDTLLCVFYRNVKLLPPRQHTPACEKAVTNRKQPLSFYQSYEIHKCTMRVKYRSS